MAGEKVRFTILNDGSDTTTATKNAQRLINEDKVDLIIGASVTPTSLAVVETAGAAQRAGDLARRRRRDRLPQDGPRKWAFKLSPTEPISIGPCSTTCRRAARARRWRRSASRRATATAS